MEKKVLLICPPLQKPMGFSAGGIPLGSLYLAGELKAHGYDVRVFDADYNPDGVSYNFVKKSEHYHDYLDALKNASHPIWGDISEHIEEYKPDVVGLSVVTPKVPSAFMIARIAKDLGVEKIVAGGPHATIRPDDFFGNGCFDSVVRYEGEYIFEKAMAGKGIFVGDRIRSLDSLAFPARETLVGLKKYREKDLGYIMTARGCPYICGFCGSPKLWGREVVERTIGNVVEEMNHVHNMREDNKVNEFYVADDTFTIKRERVKEFCDSIRNNGFKWSCLTRVNVLDSGKLENMKDAGCSMIKVGIESGSPKILKLMNKMTTVDQVRQSGKLLNKYDMPWLAYVMVGVPGETPEDVDMTMDLINEVRPSYVAFSTWTPYPGTGFTGDGDGVDWGRVSHDNWECTSKDMPLEKIAEMAEFVDRYNSASQKAHEMFKC